MNLRKNSNSKSLHCFVSSLVKASCFFFSAALSSFSERNLRVNSLVLITTPLIPGVAFKETSFTSPALSPKIARSNFSSGVGSVSPFGVILPIKISPSWTFAPILIIPLLSSSFVASSDIFGISLVNSSSPRFVSRTCKVNSSIWTEVNTSLATTLSLIIIASSKL